MRQLTALAAHNPKLQAYRGAEARYEFIVPLRIQAIDLARIMAKHTAADGGPGVDFLGLYLEDWLGHASSRTRFLRDALANAQLLLVTESARAFPLLFQLAGTKTCTYSLWQYNFGCNSIARLRSLVQSYVLESKTKWNSTGASLPALRAFLGPGRA